MKEKKTNRKKKDFRASTLIPPHPHTLTTALVEPRLREDLISPARTHPRSYYPSIWSYELVM